MARKIENKDGFHIIELTVDEAINKCQFGFATKIICDQCNKEIENKDEVIYFIAVLNMAFCKECYEDFITKATYYEEDEDYEIKQYNVVAELLGLELI